MIQKISYMLIALLCLCASLSGQQVSVYPDNYLIKTGDSAPDFTIIFLTRLYDRVEFDKMKKVIFTEIAAK